MELIKTIKKFNLIEEGGFLCSSMDAWFDYQTFENLSIEGICFTNFGSLYSRRSFVVIKKSKLTETGTLLHRFSQFYFLFELWIICRNSIFVKNNFDTTFRKNIISGTFITICDNFLTWCVFLRLHCSCKLRDFIISKILS